MTATTTTCACGGPIYPGPWRAQGGYVPRQHCKPCGRVRRWARRYRKTRQKAEVIRTDWACNACGSIQGPLENVQCSLCGCNVTTAEPVGPVRLVVIRKVEHALPDPEGTVVWNTATGCSLVADDAQQDPWKRLRSNRDAARRHRIDLAAWPGWYGQLSQR